MKICIKLGNERVDLTKCQSYYVSSSDKLFFIILRFKKGNLEINYKTKDDQVADVKRLDKIWVTV